MTLKDRINKLRRKIASPIVGNQVALFLPKDQSVKARADLLDMMSPDALTALTKWTFAVLNFIYRERAAREGVGLDTFANIHGLLSWVRTMRLAGAETLTLTQSCEIAGESVGVYRVTIERMPDDFVFGEPGVKEVHDDQGKLVEIAVSHDFRKPEEKA